jgi:glycosidase
MIHNSRPDDERLLHLVTILYGPDVGRRVHRHLLELLELYRQEHLPVPVAGGGLALSERDAILITYGDQVTRPDEAPLATLAKFCDGHLLGVVSGVHILPFFPYTSDDGFSVVDYRAVDPALGDWPDVARLGREFRLMFDAVINHVSAASAWFRGFVAGDPRYRDYFIVAEGDPDLSQVVRPRALPLLTTFDTAGGPRRVWTTFSADQVDLNYRSPDVLLEIVDTLLFYIAHGAEFIRLDAIAYAWKEIGSSCIHLPQTHVLVQLLRAVLDQVAPRVMIITETNVPHADNLSYFGDGAHEAQLVYNFALPPLLLHTLQTGSARKLSGWARELRLPSNRTTFFNFTASHDGVGLNPARGILSNAEIDALVDRTRAAGGLISYKNNPDGSQTPYECNVNYLDALSVLGETEALTIDRFMVTQAIMLVLAGVPGIYFHSLFGSRGWPEGAARTGHNRSINREKLAWAALEHDLAQGGHRRQQVYEHYRRMLSARATCPAFYPLGAQEVLDRGDDWFVLLRRGLAPGQVALCLHNVTGRQQRLRLPPPADVAPGSPWFGLIDGQDFRTENDGELKVALRPYGFEWLVPRQPLERVDARSS